MRPAQGPTALGDPLFVQHSGQIAQWRDDKWVFGFGYGNGWMVFAGSDLIGVYPYVEHTAFPLVRVFNRLGGSVTQTAGGQPVTSGCSVSVVGDTLLVLFGGEEGRGWVLDRYDARNGQYLHSDLLPHFSNRAAVGDDGKGIHTVFGRHVPGHRSADAAGGRC